MPAGVFTAPSTSQTVYLIAKDMLNNSTTAVVTVNSPLTISPASRTIGAGTRFGFTMHQKRKQVRRIDTHSQNCTTTRLYATADTPDVLQFEVAQHVPS